MSTAADRPAVDDSSPRDATGLAPAPTASAQPEPPPETQPEGGREAQLWRWAPGLVGGVALAVVAVRDPARQGSYGFCPLKALTGLDCPFCGGLRGTHDLLHGDVAAALDHNLLLPLYLAVLGWLVVSAAWPSSRVSQWPRGRGRSVVWVLLAVTLVFFVVRNLPWFPYLASGA